MRPRAYVDLDETTVGIAWPDREGAGAFVLRPWADVFLAELDRVADVWILTSATLPYAERAVRLLDPWDELIRGVISDEILERVERGIAGGRAEQVAPSGFVFDNMGVGSWAYRVKSTAVGVGPSMWIKVEPFGRRVPDRGGLERAFEEYRARALRD